MIFYYSGCGNSRFVATSMAEALDEKLIFIPEAQRDGLFEFNILENEMLGFVYPVYSWRPPRLVEEFVDKLIVNGKPSYIWTAVTCGDNVGETEKIFRKELKSRGLELDAAFCFKMPNTYINFMGMTVDREEVANEKIVKAKEKLPKVIESVRRRVKCSDMIRGRLPRFKSNVIGKSFYKWASDKPFFSTDECVACGICVKVCPLLNITLENDRPVWHGNCNTCDACYHYCPMHAVQYGNKTKGKGQYFFK